MRWEGNGSKRYDNTKEEVRLVSIVAINDMLVIDPTIDQLSVGDRIESEYVYKRGRVQVWNGIVVSVDPDAERRARVVTTTPVAESRRRQTKALGVDVERRAGDLPETTHTQQDSNKGKAKKQPLSSSPAPPEGPQQKRRRRTGTLSHTCMYVVLLYVHSNV